MHGSEIPPVEVDLAKRFAFAHTLVLVVGTAGQESYQRIEQRAHGR